MAPPFAAIRKKFLDANLEKNVCGKVPQVVRTRVPVGKKVCGSKDGKKMGNRGESHTSSPYKLTRYGVGWVTNEAKATFNDRHTGNSGSSSDWSLPSRFPQKVRLVSSRALENKTMVGLVFGQIVSI